MNIKELNEYVEWCKNNIPFPEKEIESLEKWQKEFEDRFWYPKVRRGPLFEEPVIFGPPLNSAGNPMLIKPYILTEDKGIFKHYVASFGITFIKPYPAPREIKL